MFFIHPLSSNKAKVSILNQILQDKQQEVSLQKISMSEKDLQEKSKIKQVSRSFIERLKNHPFPAIIAEMKQASPSKGVICKNYNPVNIAESYRAADAACFSILTDNKYFKGSLEHLAAVRQLNFKQPLLRKDFILDPYQILQARYYGADAVLLIVAAMKPQSLINLIDKGREAGLELLIEVHQQDEMDVIINILNSRPELVKDLMIGINNRNLHSFNVDITTSLKLMDYFNSKVTFSTPGPLLISESGISSAKSLVKLSQSGFHGFLIGEAFMKTENPGESLHSLIEEAKDMA